MNAIDRRRIVIATIFTLIALPSLWVLGRHSANGSPKVGVTGVGEVGGASATPPPTTAYQPEAPIFVGGDTEPQAHGVIEVAVPPAPSKNQFMGKASFFRYGTGVSPCTTNRVPNGTLLTVTNVDNGQFIRCRNIRIEDQPTETSVLPDLSATTTTVDPTKVATPARIAAGIDIVLDTPLFTQIANLADAPISVRVSW